jgi:hypothetical protein
LRSKFKIIRFDIIPRFIAAIFGLVLINLFRFTLDKIHIFLTQPVGLTSFAFFISFFFWAAFFYYHYLGDRNKFHSKRIFLLSLANITLFIFFNENPESNYSIIYPLFFLCQVLLNFFLLGSRFHNFLQYRIALALGALPGIYYIEYFISVWFLFPASFFLINLPYRKFFSLSRQKIQSTTRMLPFRLRLDFCRYLFLVTALWSILDEKKSDFPFIFSFLLLGSLIQLLIIRLHKKKEHIRPGLRVLALILFALAPSMLIFPLNTVSSIAYISLTIWEAVYFGKVIEGYSKREQVIAGILISFGIFFNIIQIEHMILITTALLVLAQIRILAYLYKDLRHFISVLMVLSISSWIAVTFIKVKEIEGVAFLKMASTDKNINLNWSQLIFIDQLLLKNPIRTNALPEDFHSTCYENSISKFSSIDFLIPVQLRLYNLISSDINNLFLAEKSKAYANARNFSALKREFKDKSEHNVHFLKTYNTAAESSDFSLTLRCLCRELSSHFQKIRDFEAAVHYFSFLLENNTRDISLLLKAAKLAGSAGRINEQIMLLESYIKLSKVNIREKQLLIELYFLNQQFKKSEALSRQLLLMDKKNSIFYFQWLIRLTEAQPDFSSTRRLYFLLKNWRPQSRKQEFEKNTLLLKLEQLIKLNPSFGTQFQEELDRQEFIEFPD